MATTTYGIYGGNRRQVQTGKKRGKGATNRAAGGGKKNTKGRK